MTTEDFKLISATLPTQPGVYKYFDANDTIIYVGKAKNLKNRISSYFGDKKHQAHKTRVMVKNAKYLDFTIVESEADALLLENTLIKSLQPRYNVLLKDGKSYVYLCVKKERFPRVFFTRNIVRDGSTYYGPYTSKYKTNQIFELIKALFPIRTCSYNLSADNIANEKFKVCLEYHLGNCLGPCVGAQSEDQYQKQIDQIKNILQGNFKPVKDYIKQEMHAYADELKFEKAEMMKEKFNLFEEYQSKSTVVSHTIKDIDVFTIDGDDDWAYVNYLKVINGVLINSDMIEMEKNLDTDNAELLSYVIPEIREKYNSIAPEIVVPEEIILSDSSIMITVPQRGDKRRLLELSDKNVKYHILQKRRDKINQIKKQTSSERILRTLQEDLNMDDLPLHIECFDNSNIQGTNPTASCVVFKNAKPSKKDYRKFKVKTVEGPNDFASMEEIIYRRYKRLLDEEQALPQLVIIDGGKGQLSSAMSSIDKLGLRQKITVIGIAKKLEEIYFPDDSIPVYINKKSESLKLIQQARNEAHRFALTYHRDRRSQNFATSQLKDIIGIGEKTTETLLQHYGSVKRIKEASIEDLSAIIGNQKAKMVIDGLKDPS